MCHMHCLCLHKLSKQFWSWKQLSGLTHLPDVRSSVHVNFDYVVFPFYFDLMCWTKTGHILSSGSKKSTCQRETPRERESIFINEKNIRAAYSEAHTHYTHSITKKWTWSISKKQTIHHNPGWKWIVDKRVHVMWKNNQTSNCFSSFSA